MKSIAAANALAALIVTGSAVGAQTHTHTSTFGSTYCRTTTSYSSGSSWSHTHCGDRWSQPEPVECKVMASNGELIDTGLKSCPISFRGLPGNPTEQQIKEWSAALKARREER